MQTLLLRILNFPAREPYFLIYTHFSAPLILKLYFLFNVILHELRAIAMISNDFSFYCFYHENNFYGDFQNYVTLQPYISSCFLYPFYNNWKLYVFFYFGH